MKKLISAFLAVMLLTLPCLACAEQTYRLFAFPGQIEFAAFSDGNAYVKSLVSYPQSALYQYTPGSMEEPQMVLDTLAAEVEYTMVAGDQILVFQDGSAALNTVDGNEVFELPSNGWLPYLMSIYTNDELVFLMSEDEAIHVCYYNTQTAEFKSIRMDESLYTVQPYKTGMTMLFKTNGATGSKNIDVIDWATMEQTAMGSLPAGVTSIAYSENDDALYYLAEGNLCKFSWDGTINQIASGYPLWTDQRAYILESGVFAAIYTDVDETLLTIDIPK